MHKCTGLIPITHNNSHPSFPVNYHPHRNYHSIQFVPYHFPNLISINYKIVQTQYTGRESINRSPLFLLLRKKTIFLYSYSRQFVFANSISIASKFKSPSQSCLEFDLHTLKKKMLLPRIQYQISLLSAKFPNPRITHTK